MAVDLRHERDALPLETNTDPEGNWEFTNESLAKRAEANERLLNALRQFESFLEDKVR